VLISPGIPQPNTPTPGTPQVVIGTFTSPTASVTQQVVVDSAQMTFGYGVGSPTAAPTVNFNTYTLAITAGSTISMATPTSSPSNFITLSTNTLNLNANTVSMPNTVTIGSATYTTTIGTLSVANAITGAGALNLAGAATLSGVLTVGGVANLQSTLSVVSAVTLGNTLSVFSSATVGGALSVAQTGSFGAGVTMSSTLSVASSITAGGSLNVAGGATVGGAVLMSNTLSVVGGMSGSTLSLSSSLSVSSIYVDYLIAKSAAGSAAINYAGANLAASDRKLKKNIRPIDNSLSKVKRLRGLYYHWKDGDLPQFDKRRHIGLMAQDLQNVVPEAVSTSADGSHMTVNYPSLVALLVEAIRELDEQTEKRFKAHDLRLQQIEQLMKEG